MTNLSDKQCSNPLHRGQSLSPAISASQTFDPARHPARAVPRSRAILSAFSEPVSPQGKESTDDREEGLEGLKGSVLMLMKLAKKSGSQTVHETLLKSN